MDSLPVFVPGPALALPRPKDYTCERDPACRSSFSTAFAKRRHEQNAHPLQGELTVCATCNTAIAHKLYPAHLVDCAAGRGRVLVREVGNSSSQLGLPLDTAVVDASFEPFIVWLGQPPSSLFSQKVKRSLLQPQHTQRTRTDLRNLARVCYEQCPSSFSSGFYLGGLVSKPVVDALHAFHTTGRQRAGAAETGEQGVGHDVRYRLNLLLVKLIVYLSETAPVSLLPTTFESWLAVSEASHHASKKRRLDLRTKHLLSKDEPLPTTDEIVDLLRSTIAEMDRVRRVAYEAADLSSADRVAYTNALMLASFILLSGPRQQVFRAMTTETVLAPHSNGNETDNFEVRIAGDVLKNQRPELISVPDVLTVQYRFYYARVLPLGYQGAIWRTEYGKPRADFGPPVRKTVHSIIAKRVGPHKLRAALATHHSRSDMTESDRRGLANVMDHSINTQDLYYVEQRDRVLTQHALARQWVARL